MPINDRIYYLLSFFSDSTLYANEDENLFIDEWLDACEWLRPENEVVKVW